MVIGATAGEWIGGILCVGFPAWVMFVMMLLIKYVKKPADVNDPDRQHGFPVASNAMKDSTEIPGPNNKKERD